MSFKTKVFSGALRYRASKALADSLDLTAVNQNRMSKKPPDMSAASKLRLNPCYLSLPTLALPSQLDKAAISYLRERSLSSPRAIEDRAELLGQHLWSRALMSESDVIQKHSDQAGESLSLGDVTTSDSEMARSLLSHDEASYTKMRPNARIKAENATLEDWKSLTYTGHNCELYLTARLAPNFASACRILYELRKRCPKFIPRNLFDFGSGLGTVTWAANMVWPVGCIKEHFMVDASADMTDLSEFMFRKNLAIKSPETLFPGIYHRRFLPAKQQPYDLVVCANSLIELPGKRSRERILSNLWNRTNDFLVLIEQGTKAGFAAILEARDWLINNGGDDVCIFAPCPHKVTCGKRESVCNIAVRYYDFGLTREKNDPSVELISYLIVSRGDWRRHQSPVVEADSDCLPRLVTFGLSNSTNELMHDICLPSGQVERTSFPKGRSDKTLHYFLRHARAGDIVPCEPISDEVDSSEEPSETDTDEPTSD